MRRSSIKQSRRPDQTLANFGELSAGREKWAEIRPLSALSRRAFGGRLRARGGNTDISALHGERAPQRDCISSFQRSATTKAISRRRPRIAIGRDGNRIQQQTEDARILLSSSGRRLMKHPAVKITPAGRRRRPSVAALIVSRRRRNKYRRSNYRPSSGSAT